MRRCTRGGSWLTGVLALSALAGCSPDDDTAARTPPAGPDAMAVATDAVHASGATFLGAVGGDGRSEQGASLGVLPAGGSVGAFAACTGGDSIRLDLAGATLALDCDGRAHRIADLVLPGDGMPVFR